MIRSLPLVAAIILGLLVDHGPARAWDLFGTGKLSEQVKGFNDEVARLRNDLTSISDKYEKLGRAAIKAVPGERLLQLYDALHGADDEARKEAQAILKRMGNFDPDASYEASLWVGYPEGKNARVDLFRAPTGDRSHVQLYVTRSLNWREPRSSLTPPPGREAIEQAVHQHVMTALKALVGSRNETFSSGQGQSGSLLGPQVAWTWPEFPFVDGNAYPDHQSLSRDPKLHRKSVDKAMGPARRKHDAAMNGFALELKKAILAAHRYERIAPNDGRERLPWNVIDGNSYLFVLLPESVYLNFHKRTGDSSLKLEALVHGSDDLTTGLNFRPAYKFNIGEFDPVFHPPIDNPRPGGERVYWAVQEMGGSSTLTEGELEEIAAVRRDLEEFARLRAEQGEATLQNAIGESPN